MNSLFNNLFFQIKLLQISGNRCSPSDETHYKPNSFSSQTGSNSQNKSVTAVSHQDGYYVDVFWYRNKDIELRMPLHQLQV